MSKLKPGRNDPCPCGSGNKYKKCCCNVVENKDEKLIVKEKNKHPGPLATSTGELFSLCRLEYVVFDKNLVLKTFEKLKCINYDYDNNIWVWTLEREAKSIQLGNASAKKLKTKAPIIIGKISLKENLFTLDLRSHERAIAAILFFNKYLPHNSTKVTDMYVYNKLFVIEDASNGSVMKIDLDKVFAMENIETIPDVMEILEPVKIMDNVADRIGATLKIMDKVTQEKLLLTEKLPVHFYEDGISSLKLSLSSRQRITYEHFIGNVNYTYKDFIYKYLLK